MKKLLIALLFSIPSLMSYAQGFDPTLTGMILMYTNKAEKQFKSQEKIMMLESTGHIWIKEEVEGTVDLHKEFNEYLDSFNSIICYAAQIYGFYHEIDKLVENLQGFAHQLSRHPSNALAVALSAEKNRIYRNLIMGSVDIVNDIRQVCLSDNKMTEKERMEVVFMIRPKLKVMNLHLRRLTRAVRYTTMADIWYVIDQGAREPADKHSITRQCMERWKRNGRKGF